jgi:excisionase family DNA binding protein
MERLTLRVGEICEALGIGRTTVYKLIGQGDLETLKIGRRTFITKRSAQALIARSLSGVVITELLLPSD